MGPDPRGGQVVAVPVNFSPAGGVNCTVSLTDFIFFFSSLSLFFFSLKITFNIYFPAVYKLTSSTHKSGMLCFLSFKLNNKLPQMTA